MTHLTIALDRVDFLPPDRVTDNAAILTLKAHVFEPLVRWRDGRIEPALFAGWESDAAGRDWQFRLRDGARFHDGAPCTGADVVAFLTAILDSRDMFGMRWSYARYFAGAEMTATPAGVRFACPAPFADLPEVLSEFYIARRDGAGRAILGTGAWRVAAFTPGETATLTPIDPAQPTLTFTAMTRAEDRLAALRAGAIDAAAGLEQADEPPTETPDLTWLHTVNTLSVMAYLNCTAGAFADPRARLAANLAIDRARLIAEVYGGRALAANTVVSPWHTGHAEAGLESLPFDPERAGALLATTDGPREIIIRTPDHMPERAPAIAARIARDLAAVGFQPRIECIADRPGYARAIAAKDMGDLAIFDSSPHVTFRVLDDNISSATQALWWQGFADAETEALFATARASQDPDRAAAYGRVLARLNAAPPWLYLVHPVALAAQRPGTFPLTLDAKGVLSPLPRTLP